MANRLIDQANKLAAPMIRSRLTTGLEFATRLTASNASQLAAVSEEAARHSRSSQYRVSEFYFNPRSFFAVCGTWHTLTDKMLIFHCH